MLQTIADLAVAQQPKTTVVAGQSMIKPASPEEQLAMDRADYIEEYTMLQEGDDNRTGNAAWRTFMKEMGRR